MDIRQLSAKEFKDFNDNHPMGNYRQTLNFALLKAQNDYEYEMIGYVDNNNNIKAAALVLVKLLNGHIYAYIPEGMLIDYNNSSLVKDFTEKMVDFYKGEKIFLIRINPPVIQSEIDIKTFEPKNMINENVLHILEDAGWIKYDDALIKKYNTIIELDNYKEENLSKNAKNKIRKGLRKGLSIELADVKDLDILIKFAAKKMKVPEYYYNDIYTLFNKDDSIDYFLVKINYKNYVFNSQNAYQKELKRNEKIIEKLSTRNNEKNVNKKMSSDNTLRTYKEDVAKAASKLNTESSDYVAGAFVIKQGNKATIVVSAYNKKYKDFAPNYFLYNEIIKYYKGKYKYLDLNGILGDNDKNNPFYGVNQFKLGFKPNMYQPIGDYVYILNKRLYNKLNKKGILQKEFNLEKMGK